MREHRRLDLRAALRGRERALAVVVALMIAVVVGRVAAQARHPSASVKAGTPSSPAEPRPAPMLEKLVLAPEFPATRGELEVGERGQLYFPSGGAYFQYDEAGRYVGRFSAASKAGTIVPLASGFVAALAGGRGHVALLRADGSEARSLVARGPNRSDLRRDSTGWTTPTGMAVDEARKLIFVVDSTQAKDDTKPDWSRIAVFDLSGKFLRDFAAYDATAANPDRTLATWYDDIEVDAKQKHVLLTARYSQELRAYDYEGTLLGAAPGVGGVAVFADGRVAVGDVDRRHVIVYDKALARTARLDAAAVRDLEVDAKGRLLATLDDTSVLLQRWDAALHEMPALRASFSRLRVAVPPPTSVAGEPLELVYETSGAPRAPSGELQAWARPSDGSRRPWLRLEARVSDGKLRIQPPGSLLGDYELVIRVGDGPLPATSAENELSVATRTSFVAQHARPRVGLVSRQQRTAFIQGELIPLAVAREGGAPDAQRLVLRSAETQTMQWSATPSSAFVEVPREVSARLMPGSYEIVPECADCESVAFRFEIAQSAPDSPVQRILYHEFDQTPVTSAQPGLRDHADRLSFIQSYLDHLQNWGFTRETDRSGLRLLGGSPGRLPLLGATADRQIDGRNTTSGQGWEMDEFLDRALARGVHYDTQLFAHCANVPLEQEKLAQLGRSVQLLAQWLDKYPAFYGFNFNDEIFFDNQSFAKMPEEDRQWLRQFRERNRDASAPDAFRAGLERFYGALSGAIRRVDSRLARTATPMWQYPAVEGSYAPTVYGELTESYSHYLSEGFNWAFSAPHSVDMLRRPGRPLMGVFDNGFKSLDGEGYLKAALQVLARGVQGVGVSHARPFQDAAAADAFRVANQVARVWGPIFAQARPDNDGLILYSYAQDVTEKRHVFGTPHWERVFALYGVAQMAKMPLGITYEEDVAAGALLESGKPRVPLLFLVGQKVSPSARAREQIRAYMAAGGRVFVDTESAPFEGAKRLALPLEAVLAHAEETLDGDAIFPDSQAAYLELSVGLRQAAAQLRGFAADVDYPWTVLSRFRAGDVRYVALASEAGPYPYLSGDLWRLGARYNQGTQPRTDTLSLPGKWTVYDAFEQRVAVTTQQGSGAQSTTQVRADLRAFPGRTYALLSKPIPPPKLRLDVKEDELGYQVDVGIRGGVPLRLRLLERDAPKLELYRLSGDDGRLAGSLPRPLDGTVSYTLEVSELLSGQASSVAVNGAASRIPVLVPSPAVTLDAPAVRALFAANRPICSIPPDEVGGDESYRQLLRALRGRAKHVVENPACQALPVAGVTVVPVLFADGALKGVALEAFRHGLLPELGAGGLGPGRSLVRAGLALRRPDEDVLLLLASDRAGLKDGLAQLARAIGSHGPEVGQTRRKTVVTTLMGRATAARPWRLSEHVGARLFDVRASNGRIAVSAKGSSGNLVLVEEQGTTARVVESRRLGDSPLTSSLFLSQDGQVAGLAARSLEPFGEGFFLGRVGGAPTDAFASFGDLGGTHHPFGVAADGRTVVAPGPHGVVAWRLHDGRWSEAWRDAYYGEFDHLDWPVAADQEREAWFEALVPPRASFALVGFGELTQNGWMGRQVAGRVAVAARDLTDGRVLWRYDVAPSGQLMFPHVHASADGELVLLTLEIGSGRSVTSEQRLLSRGQLVATWRGSALPSGVSLNGGHVLIVYGNRVVELRDAAGRLEYSKLWAAQPTAVILDATGAGAALSDDLGHLTRLDAAGDPVWSRDLGVSAALANAGDRLYAAGWDGRLRALDTRLGAMRYELDLTPALLAPTVARSSLRVFVAKIPAQSSSEVPKGPNLLATRAAKLTVGGTVGWKSRGSVSIRPELLTNHDVSDCPMPWLTDNELYWSAVAGRQVWAEIEFQQPTRVNSLTVYEDSRFPESFPSEAQIEVWDDAHQSWQTVKHPVSLAGAVNTYALGLERVRRLRYVPWGSYYRNFHTSEIEVR